MNYQLVYTRRVEKDIKKLDPTVKRAIAKSLLKLQNNPIQYSEKLTDLRTGTYRSRTGDYRVIFDIEDRDIVILRIGHRKDIYKSL